MNPRIAKLHSFSSQVQLAQKIFLARNGQDTAAQNMADRLRTKANHLFPNRFHPPFILNNIVDYRESAGTILLNTPLRFAEISGTKESVPHGPLRQVVVAGFTWDLIMSTHIQEHLATLDPAACWSLVERVAATPSLKRAARLREFLLFVANKSLKEGRVEIHEQEIGETVFARPRSYDTSQDNIVRVSATELRKRVEAYFAAEGSAEPIVFEIPRGSYLPLFRLREKTVSTEPTSLAAPQPVIVQVAPAEQTQATQRHVLLWTISAIAALLALACFLLWRQNATLLERIQILEHQHSMVRQLPHGASTAFTLGVSS